MHYEDKTIKKLSSYLLFEDVAKFFLFELDLHFNFDSWFIGEIKEDKYHILFSEGRLDAFKPGKILNWEDTICSHMVKVEGPSIVPDINQVQPYVDTKIAKDVGIQAYIGSPIYKGNDLFGTLCAVSKTTQPDAILEEEKYIYKVTKTLSLCLIDNFKPANENIMRISEGNMHQYMQKPRLVEHISPSV